MRHMSPQRIDPIKTVQHPQDSMSESISETPDKNKDKKKPKISNVERSPFLQQIFEVVTNATENKLDPMSIKGHVIECSEDQFGSRFIQTELDKGNDRFCQMIFDECLAGLKTLTVDVFGNYVIQKLIKNGKTLHRAVIID